MLLFATSKQNQRDPNCYDVCCCLYQQRSLAVSLLDEMAELGCPPGSVTFASAMLACERAGQWQHVLRIMDQVQNKYIIVFFCVDWSICTLFVLFCFSAGGRLNFSLFPRIFRVVLADFFCRQDI